MRWSVPLMWEGGDVWIIGGGPSINSQFNIPDKIVKEVRQGTLPTSTYSPYMKEIHNKHVIAVNAAYLLGDWMDIIFFGDNGFFLSHMDALAVHPAIKVTCWPTLENQYDWVKFLGRDPEKPKGLTKDITKVSWNKNSGAAAINLAAHTGAKRIFLLGFDMTLDPKTNYQHFHNVYKRGAVVEEERLRKLPFDRHLYGFLDIAEDAKERGIQIINISPESAIQQFPKYTLQEALKL